MSAPVTEQQVLGLITDIAGLLEKWREQGVSVGTASGAIISAGYMIHLAGNLQPEGLVAATQLALTRRPRRDMCEQLAKAFGLVNFNYDNM